MGYAFTINGSAYTIYSNMYQYYSASYGIPSWCNWFRFSVQSSQSLPSSIDIRTLVYNTNDGIHSIADTSGPAPGGYSTITTYIGANSYQVDVYVGWKNSTDVSWANWSPGLLLIGNQ